MSWRGCVAVLVFVLAVRVAAAAAPSEPVSAAGAPPAFAVSVAPSLLELDGGANTAVGPELLLSGPGGTPGRGAGALGAERARILLRSLTLPGWGQATLGHRGSATFFGLTETAIWGTFTAFRIQVAMREDAYLRTARLMAGIDLRGRDEEWRRIVGGYSSSDAYNQLVVARDAANLYYNDPEAYRAYVAAHSLGGADAWRWADSEAQKRYSSQRKMAQRAAQRANTVLAVAVVNRLVSALHAARVAGHDGNARAAAEPRPSWRIEAVPAPGDDALAFQLRVRAQF